jgi:hypothetical protein
MGNEWIECLQLFCTFFVSVGPRTPVHDGAEFLRAIAAATSYVHQ